MIFVYTEISTPPEILPKYNQTSILNGRKKRDHNIYNVIREMLRYKLLGAPYTITILNDEKPIVAK